MRLRGTLRILVAVMLIGYAAPAISDDGAEREAAIVPAAYRQAAQPAAAAVPPRDSGEFPESDYALDASESYDMSEMPPNAGLEHLRTEFASRERSVAP